MQPPLPPPPRATACSASPCTADLLTPQASFAAVSGRLLVGPVVRTLVYDKIPNTVADWVDSICTDWPFTQIIPAHFSAPVRAGAHAAPQQQLERQKQQLV